MTSRFALGFGLPPLSVELCAASEWMRRTAGLSKHLGLARPNLQCTQVCNAVLDKKIIVCLGEKNEKSVVYNQAMPQSQPNNPLHGIKLKQIVEELVDYYGWEQLSRHINIRCFENNPSVKSCLKFLRRTPWARAKVEELYLEMIGSKQ
jgi:hypothetical protein